MECKVATEFTWTASFWPSCKTITREIRNFVCRGPCNTTHTSVQARLPWQVQPLFQIPSRQFQILLLPAFVRGEQKVTDESMTLQQRSLVAFCSIVLCILTVRAASSFCWRIFFSCVSSARKIIAFRSAFFSFRSNFRSAANTFCKNTMRKSKTWLWNELLPSKIADNEKIIYRHGSKSKLFYLMRNKGFQLIYRILYRLIE